VGWLPLCLPWSRGMYGLAAGPVGYTESRPSCGPERGVYALAGNGLAVIEALGVDPEQDFDAVTGPLGDFWRRNPGIEPE
jgi:hypothetical protein